MRNRVHRTRTLGQCAEVGWVAMIATVVLPVVVGLVGAVQVGVAQGDEHDWPQFLGPHRNGISSETGLLETFPTEGPPVVWKVEGGVGMSGLAVVGGTAFTLVQDAEQQYVLALDAKTGKTRWKTPVAPSYKNQMGNGPRATPTVSGERVVVFTGQGRLVALDVQQGRVAWQHDTIRQQRAKVADYGMASSPLITNDLVIVAVGAPQGTVVAYKLATGEVAWKAGTGAAGYSSPAVLEVGGRQQLVAFTARGAVGLDVKTGRPFWDYPFKTPYDCNIATPIAVGGHVFISSGENHGSVLLRVKAGERPHVVWTSLGARSVLRNEWQTSILLDGFLFGFDNVGSAGPVTHLTCVKADDGQRSWQKIRFGKGNMIAADGKLWVITTKGELVLLRANSKKFEELGRAQILDFTRQAPALSGGRLYLRDDKHIVCLDVSAK